MSHRKRYLDMLGRLRARFRNMSLSSKRWLVAAVIFVVVVIVMSIEISPFGFLLEEGKPSNRTILAPSTVQFVDEAKTREQRDAAAAAVQDVYEHDAAVEGAVLSNLDNFFRIVNEVDALRVDKQEKVKQISGRVKKNVFADSIGDLLSLNPEQREQVHNAAVQAAKLVMEDRITPDSMAEAYGKARQIVGQVSADPDVQRIAGELSTAFIEPNSVLDTKETERRKKAVRDAAKPVITTKLEGEVIVSKGETVTQDQVELLKSLGFKRSTFTPLNLLFSAIFALALLGAASMFLARFRRTVFDSPGLLVLLGGLVIFYTILAKLLVFAATSWSPLFGYMMPSAGAAIITAVLLDGGTAIFMVVICSLITGAVSGGNFPVVAFTLLGGLFPAFFVSRMSGRHELRRSGLYTALWLALVAFSASALSQVRQDLLLHAGMGFINGVVCSVVALGSLQFLETTFRITTKTWLLELASPEQELLKELSMKAPGTYSHSVMVANLAEAAAREVGSDSMTARVAAYYHDVGKMRRAQFFVENQPQDRNPHENISPNLSCLIITSHVKDGVEMLEKNHIPPDLVEVIKQHHGTSVVRYFYERALEVEGKESVEESRFRYHFEKPRRRTAGILLLADAVEATARTLNRPSAASIEQMVERIVDGKLEDGQMDDCDLTFHDISKIKKVFTKILISTYHPRIDYPSATSVGGKRKSAGKNNSRITAAETAGSTVEKGA